MDASPDAGTVDAHSDAGGLQDGGFPTACALDSDDELEEQLSIRDLVAPGTDCSHAIDDATLPSGVLDIELATHYFMAVRLDNELAEFAVLETAIIAHRDGEMCVPPGGGPQAVSETVPAEAVDVAFLLGIPDSVGVTMIPGPTVVSIAFEALTQDGRQIVTPTFGFGLIVCEGCLQMNLGLCDAVSPPFDIPCFVGQDDPVDCCTDAVGDVQCPPP